MNKTVIVNLNDLSELAKLICDRDTGKVPPTVQNIDACHDLLIKMMGEHVSDYYDDDEKEAA